MTWTKAHSRSFNKTLNSSVSTIFSRPKHNGDAVGIELEVEATTDLPLLQDAFWITVADNSLRGNSAEYVSASPLEIQQVEPALLAWKASMKDVGLRESIRTSSHVHFNVSDRKISDVMKAILFYFMVEDVLIASQGPYRIGNHFCCSSTNATDIIESIVMSFVEASPLVGPATRGNRYGSLNLCALQKLGTLELRFFRSMTPADVNDFIFEIVSIQEALNEAMLKPSMNSIIELYRRYSNGDFLRIFFSRNFVEYLTDKVRNRGFDWSSMINNSYPPLYRMVQEYNRYEKLSRENPSTSFRRPVILVGEDLSLEGDTKKLQSPRLKSYFGIDPTDSHDMWIIDDIGPHVRMDPGEVLPENPAANREEHMNEILLLANREGHMDDILLNEFLQQAGPARRIEE